MGKYPSANIHIDSHHQFPDFAFEPVVGHERTESESTDRSASPIFSLSSSRGCEPASLASSLSNESEYTGMSFAKVSSFIYYIIICSVKLANFCICGFIDDDGDGEYYLNNHIQNRFFDCHIQIIYHI